MPWLGRRLAAEARLARLAGGIADPILRLKFLRAAAPRTRLLLWVSQWQLRHWILCLGLPLALLIPFLIKLAAGKPKPLHTPPIALRHAAAGEAEKIVPVWQVEQTADSEVYSNGLRIDTRFTVSNRARLYTAFQWEGASTIKRVRRSQPAGIVYHTSESCQAPFEAQDTPVLKRLGESLLEYVRRKRAYHYLIDRFGRVYRVVAETDTANHAGYSVWADDEAFYLNLNNSFLGVSFEAQSQPGQTQGVASPAQVRVAAMLTEMLRSRYRIPAGNCVTHAQVSVNPSNMLVGYHQDWAAGFPFAELGLPDNYQRALPSLWAFGFDCEPAWRASGGNQMSLGVKLAELDIARRAAAAGMRPAPYRRILREQYRAWLAEIRRSGPPVAQLSSGSTGR
ncbi:MAG: peptidoglycan recognition family protein [Bryobacteraceae bacterium]